ncbi:hypothetical protein AMTRI_Chr12g239420 [Amborella trichopoda]
MRFGIGFLSLLSVIRYAFSLSCHGIRLVCSNFHNARCNLTLFRLCLTLQNFHAKSVVGFLRLMNLNANSGVGFLRLIDLNQMHCIYSELGFFFCVFDGIIGMDLLDVLTLGAF